MIIQITPTEIIVDLVTIPKSAVKQIRQRENNVVISRIGADTRYAVSDVVIDYTKTVYASVADLLTAVNNWFSGLTSQSVMYDCSGGLKVFDAVVKDNTNMLTVETNQQGLDAADSYITVEQSLDGINYNPIVDTLGVAVKVLLSDPVSSCLNVNGVKSRYIKATWNPASVTAGLIKTLTIY